MIFGRSKANKFVLFGCCQRTIARKSPCNFPWDVELARNEPRVDQLVSNSLYKTIFWRFRAVSL